MTISVGIGNSLLADSDLLKILLLLLLLEEDSPSIRDDLLLGLQQSLLHIFLLTFHGDLVDKFLAPLVSKADVGRGVDELRNHVHCEGNGPEQSQLVVQGERQD